MKTLRFLCLFFAASAAVTVIAADAVGTWRWTTHSPNGEIETTLRLQSKDGQLAGAYSNQFGDAAISNASLEGDVLAFDVVRDLGGSKYVVKYRGRLEGDSIKGTIEAPGRNGGEALKLDWNAKRMPKEKVDGVKPKN